MLDTSRSAMKYQYQLNKQLADQNRNWQERMTNTAHQREIKDLKAAGLNPVLSVTGGNGATTPSGSTASVSDGAGYFSALANLEAAQINSATQLAIHETPGGNTLFGQVKYLADELGVDVDDVLASFGVSLTGGSTNGGSNSNSSATKISKSKQYAYDSIELSMSKILVQMRTARTQGKYGKAEKLGRKLDQLAFYYPEQYQNVTGKKPAQFRGNDYYAKNYRNRKQAY